MAHELQFDPVLFRLGTAFASMPGFGSGQSPAVQAAIERDLHADAGIARAVEVYREDQERFDRVVFGP